MLEFYKPDKDTNCQSSYVQDVYTAMYIIDKKCAL